MITPIEISREITSRKNRSLASIGGKPKRLKAEELAAKFGGSKIGEFGDAVDGGGIQILVQPGSPQVRLENTEPVVVLLSCTVRLAVLGLEVGEVVLGVQQVILLVVRNDLSY